MFGWVKKLFDNSDPISEELDRRIAAADARIAAKEQILSNLQQSVDEKKAEVQVLKDRVNRMEKTLKRGEN